MNNSIEQMPPGQIEERSFQIIGEMLGDKKLDPNHAHVIKRVIHTTADFEYADNLVFSKHVVKVVEEALLKGAHIVTDTNMAKAGINQKKLAAWGGNVHCFMADDDVAAEASRRNVTRAVVSMEKAARLDVPLIFALGNAPTALIRLCELIREGSVKPVAVIGVPVGFVNVIESKELLLTTDVPRIVAKGRKGGSNVSAAICNAMIYHAHEHRA